MRIAFPTYLRSSLTRTVLSLYCSPPATAHLVSPFAKCYSVSRSMAARPANSEFVRDDLEELLRRRFFLSRAFDIYGGVAGLYDLGVRSSLTKLTCSLLDVRSKRISSTIGVVISFWRRICLRLIVPCLLLKKFL
jgi:hypothetical protein